MDYGTVSFEGRTIRLTEEAQLTNRLLSINDFHDAAEGEEYDAEWSADGVDVETGEDVRVYWIHTDTKGEEREAEYYDWDDVDRIVPVE